MKLRYSSRLFLYFPFVVLLALALASVLRWRQLAGGFEQRLLAANRGHEIAPGVSLRFGSETIRGIPFNLDAALDNVTFIVNASHGPFTWHAEHFAIHELTYGRAQQVFEAAGKQSLSWTDANSRLHRFEFVPGSLRASAMSMDGSLVRFDLDLESIGARDLSGAGAQLHLRRSGGAIDFAISADALHVATNLQIGFGADIARFSLSGRFVPAAAFLPLFAGDDEWRHAAETWRQGDGSFHLDHVLLAAGRCTIFGSGNLSLDATHRARGIMDLDVVEPEVLPAAGVDAPGFARALKLLSNENFPKTHFHLLATLDAGSAGLLRKNAPESRVSAGALDPFY